MRPVEFPMPPADTLRSFAAQPAAADALIVDLRGLFAVLRRRVAWIAGVTAATTLLALLMILQTPVRYSATTQLLVDPRDLRVVRSESVLRNEQPDPNLLSEVESALSVIQSTTTLLRVIEREQLDSDPEFVGEPGFLAKVFGSGGDKADRTTKALSVLVKRVGAKRADRSFVVDVSVWTRDPQKSKRIADAVALAYLDQDGEARGSSTAKAAADLASRLSELAARVQDAERKVEEYKVANNIVGANGRLVNEQQLTELNNQLVLARARTSEQQARYEQIQRVRTLPGGEVGILDGFDSTAMAQLRSRYAEVQRLEADARTRFGPRHPEFVSIAAQTREVRRSLDAELTRIATSVKQDYERARASEASLAAKLEDLKRQVVETGGASVRLRELERGAEASRAIYASFLARAGELNEQRGINTSATRIVARAVAPELPSSPARSIVLAGGILVGLMLGLGAAIARDQLDDRLFERRQFEAVARVPVMAEISRKAGGVAAATLNPSLHRIVQGWHQRQRRRPHTVLLVPASPTTSRGTLAYDLGVVAQASFGKTLLVDGDLRGAALSKQLGAGGGGRTAADVLLNGAPLATSVLADPATGLTLLPSTGGVSAVPTAASVASRIVTVGAEYGAVVIDAASLLEDPACFGYIAAADEVLLVCEAGKTRRPDLAASVEGLGVAGQKLTGLVLLG